MKVRFWGTRGSIPTPGPSTVRYGGNTACVEVRDSSGSLLILDAGTGLRELGLALMNGGGPRPFSVDLLLSHLHWDHIQGIPFFRPAFEPKTSLRIRGPKQSRSLRELLGLGMDDPFFPVDLDDLPARLEVGELHDGSDERIGHFVKERWRNSANLLNHLGRVTSKVATQRLENAARMLQGQIALGKTEVGMAVVEPALFVVGALLFVPAGEKAGRPFLSVAKIFAQNA